MMTSVFFARHAEPVHSHPEDCTRPLTAEGLADRSAVLTALLADGAAIDVCFCSPYLRSMDTIRPAAEYFGLPILTDSRLREREAGSGGNVAGMFQRRWADHDFHEEGGESIRMVQTRNVAALTDILDRCPGRNILIGTHGTALSSIMNHYDPSFGCDDFLRIINWMPYILRLDFDGQRLVSVRELAHVEKVFTGK